MPFIWLFRVVFYLGQQLIYLIKKNRFKSILVRSSPILTNLIINIYNICLFCVEFCHIIPFFIVGKN